jgi:serine/threonine-protein kinase
VGEKDASAHLQPGELLAERYRLVEKLGGGGMGVVWRAQHVALAAPVAVKVLLHRPDEDREELVRRFEIEARAAAALRSTHVVQVLDHGVHRGQPFLVMELLEGETLRARLRARGTLPPAETVQVVAQAARALSIAHRVGIVHRDLKPENLFFAREGNHEVLKVLDFGVARRLGPHAGLVTQSGAMLGTPAYMSPEQAEGQRDLDARSDLWSLALIAFECLCGQRAFDGDGLGEVVLQICARPMPVPTDVAHVPVAVDAWFARAAARERGARFATAEDLTIALCDALGESVPSFGSLSAPAAPAPAASGSPLIESLGGARMPTLPPPKRPARVNRRTTWALAAAAVSVAALASLRLARPERSERSEPATSPAVLTSASVPPREPPAFAPAGARLEPIAAYRAGIECVRGASILEASRQLERAVALDPGMGAAHVRLALLESAAAPEEARAHWTAASRLQDDLSPRDRAFLDALEPKVIQRPQDPAEGERRTLAALARFPDDPELLWLLAQNRLRRRDIDGSIAASVRAAEVDPKMAVAWWSRAAAEESSGHVDAAFASLDRCLEIAPTAGSCLRSRARLLEDLGECSRAEADARRMIAIEPDGARPYEFLANALFARGEREAGFEALRASWARVPEARRAARVHFDQARVALVEGDFDLAVKEAREGDQATQSTTAEEEKSEAFQLMFGALLESGRDAAAADEAARFVARRAAWVPGYYEALRDPTMRALAFLRDAGRIPRPTFEARRDEWVRLVSPTASNVGDLWILGSAEPASDAAEARAALATLESHAPLRVGAIAAAAVGRVRWLAGDPSGAAADLSRAAQACTVMIDPVRHTQALVWLGQAAAAAGDRGAACAAYTRVLSRWSAAKPRSVSADKARKAVRTLGCAGGAP